MDSALGVALHLGATAGTAGICMTKREHWCWGVVIKWLSEGWMVIVMGSFVNRCRKIAKGKKAIRMII